MFNGNIKRDATITKIELSCVFLHHIRWLIDSTARRTCFFFMIYLFSFFACLVILFFDNIYIYKRFELEIRKTVLNT